MNKSRFTALQCVLLLAAVTACHSPATASSQPKTQDSSPADMSSMNMDDPGMMGHDMAHMAGHMYMTKLRPLQPGDQKKADDVIAAVKAVMEPYKDYKKAIEDGYKIFLPNIPQPQYHFTKNWHGIEASFHFNPSKPTSLLYNKTADGGYQLVGAMYTDRQSASEDDLNERIPLSIARWHQHLNFCKAPKGQEDQYFGPNAKFGLMGSITTKEACDAAGGDFHAHVLGWMVHIYPYETDPKKIWSMQHGDEDHDNMDHSSMPGMQME